VATPEGVEIYQSYRGHSTELRWLNLPYPLAILIRALGSMSVGLFQGSAVSGHRRRSSVNFRGHDIFARKICMNN